MPKKFIQLSANEVGDFEIVSHERSPAERRARKAYGAKCGHVKRLLIQNKPLTGDLIEFVCEGLVEENMPGDLKTLYGKLKAKQPLNDYELYYMVDVILLHMRLGL